MEKRRWHRLSERPTRSWQIRKPRAGKATSYRCEYGERAPPQRPTGRPIPGSGVLVLRLAALAKGQSRRDLHRSASPLGSREERKLDITVTLEPRNAWNASCRFCNLIASDVRGRIYAARRPVFFAVFRFGAAVLSGAAVIVTPRARSTFRMVANSGFPSSPSAR